MTDKLDKDVVTIDWKGGSYTGEVSDGVPHGKGAYTHPDGEKYVGEWKDNKPWNGAEYDKDGNLIEKETFVDGKLTE